MSIKRLFQVKFNTFMLINSIIYPGCCIKFARHNSPSAFINKCQDLTRVPSGISAVNGR